MKMKTVVRTFMFSEHLRTAGTFIQFFIPMIMTNNCNDNLSESELAIFVYILMLIYRY